MLNIIRIVTLQTYTAKSIGKSILNVIPHDCSDIEPTTHPQEILFL
jgi:hypothetical protein